MHLPASYGRNYGGRMRSQFDIENAEVMLVSQKQLEDREGRMQYEHILLAHLESIENNPMDYQGQFQLIPNISKSYQLKNCKQDRGYSKEAELNSPITAQPN